MSNFKKLLEEVSKMELPYFDSPDDSKYYNFSDKEFNTKNFVFSADIECIFENQIENWGDENYIMTDIENIRVSSVGELELTEDQILELEKTVINLYKLKL